MGLTVGLFFSPLLFANETAESVLDELPALVQKITDLIESPGSVTEAVETYFLRLVDEKDPQAATRVGTTKGALYEFRKKSSAERLREYVRGTLPESDRLVIALIYLRDQIEAMLHKQIDLSPESITKLKATTQRKATSIATSILNIRLKQINELRARIQELDRILADQRLPETDYDAAYFERIKIHNDYQRLVEFHSETKDKILPEVTLAPQRLQLLPARLKDLSKVFGDVTASDISKNGWVISRLASQVNDQHQRVRAFLEQVEQSQSEHEALTRSVYASDTLWKNTINQAAALARRIDELMYRLHEVKTRTEFGQTTTETHFISFNIGWVTLSSPYYQELFSGLFKNNISDSDRTTWLSRLNLLVQIYTSLSKIHSQLIEEQGRDLTHLTRGQFSELYQAGKKLQREIK